MEDVMCPAKSLQLEKSLCCCPIYSLLHSPHSPSFSSSLCVILGNGLLLDDLDDLYIPCLKAMDFCSFNCQMQSMNCVFLTTDSILIIYNSLWGMVYNSVFYVRISSFLFSFFSDTSFSSTFIGFFFYIFRFLHLQKNDPKK